MKIPVHKIKAIRETLGLTHLVIFGVAKSGQQHVGTHGETVRQACEAATAGNKLKAVLGWPEDLCKAKPVKRECRNCSYFQPDRTGVSRHDFQHGACMLDPVATRATSDHACMHFLPNN